MVAAPLVKICGVCRPHDATEAVAAGATHVGVIRVPGARRKQALEDARRVCRAAGGAQRVGVYVDAPEAMIVAEAERLELDVIQLHGSEPPSRIGALREWGLQVWKVVKPDSAGDLLEAASRYEAADLLLVEGRSGRGHGGVGARFDWAAMAPVLPRLPAGTRLGVGGGLTPGNVAEAVRRFRPALVDVSSGVEAAFGEKDAERVRRFVQAARLETEA